MENTWGRINGTGQPGGYGTSLGVRTLFQAVPLGRSEHPQVFWQIRIHVKGIFSPLTVSFFIPVELRLCKVFIHLHKLQKLT